MMKKLVCLVACGLLLCNTLYSQKRDTLLMQPIEIKAVRANEKAPFTKSNLSKKEIEKANLGQDIPFVLQQLPSVVINSDAGNGVGYTGIRIRGTDATRINMTINGIPYNDAESQGIFFVDLPDILSSVNSLQVQRGVGTSSNGSGTFGATLNLATNEINDSTYAELNNSYGSFNTWKNTVKIGSGLLAKHFTIDARGSLIKSDGYVDRAASDLKSFYVSTAWLTANNSLRLNIFSGKEKTYQSWYGVSESDLKTNRTINYAGMEKAGNPYANQTDNYWQTHYQLFYNQKINSRLAFNTALFLTRGYGYYEEYKAGQAFADYGLPDYHNGNQVISTTDLVRQLWLDNYFYGGIFSLQQQGPRSQFTLGGGYNKYDGKHYGIITWAEKGVPANYQYYDLTAYKQDLNVYGKLQHSFNSTWSGFADLQLRNVNYTINGFKGNPQLKIDTDYLFVNPKIGLTYTNNGSQVYLSYSIASHEPNRDDFEAGKNFQPKPEVLHDVELGAEKKTEGYSYGAVAYYMYYHNQLVLTGKINDVGAYTRTNTPSSYRLGIELQGKASLLSWLNASANLAFSRNKIRSFTEYVDDYDNGGQKMYQHTHSNISFSPDIVAAANVEFIPVKNGSVSLLSKYVGRQFLDNTSKFTRSLDPYFLQDVRFAYSINARLPKKIDLIFQVNNVFNVKYEPNGYTFSYIYGGAFTTENFYFPMAGVNFMAGVNIKF